MVCQHLGDGINFCLGLGSGEKDIPVLGLGMGISQDQVPYAPTCQPKLDVFPSLVGQDLVYGLHGCNNVLNHFWLTKPTLNYCRFGHEVVRVCGEFDVDEMLIYLGLGPLRFPVERRADDSLVHKLFSFQ